MIVIYWPQQNDVAYIIDHKKG